MGCLWRMKTLSDSVTKKPFRYHSSYLPTYSLSTKMSPPRPSPPPPQRRSAHFQIFVHEWREKCVCVCMYVSAWTHLFPNCQRGWNSNLSKCEICMYGCPHIHTCIHAYPSSESSEEQGEAKLKGGA